MARNPLTQSSLAQAPQTSAPNPLTQGVQQIPEFNAPDLNPLREAVQSQVDETEQLRQQAATQQAQQATQQSSMPSYDEVTAMLSQQRAASNAKMQERTAIEAAAPQATATDSDYQLAAVDSLLNIYDKNKDFYTAYGNLSQDAQRNALKQIAKDQAKATGLNEDLVYQALLNEMKAIPNDRANKDDLTWGNRGMMSVVDGVRDTGVLVLRGGMKATSALLGSVPQIAGNVLMYAPATVGAGLDAVGTAANNLISDDKKEYVTIDGAHKQYMRAWNKIMPFASISQLGEDADKYARTQLASDIRANKDLMFAENTSTDDWKSNAGYAFRNFDTALMYVAPDLLASIGAVGAINRVRNFSTTAQRSVAQSIDNVGAKATLGQSISQVGVPIGIYSGGSLLGDLSDDEKIMNATQVNAMAASVVTSALTGGLSAKFGGSLESLAIRNRGIPTWATQGYAGRIGQGVAIEGVTEAFEEAQQTTASVSLGDKNKAQFSFDNIDKNMATIITSSVIGGMVGAASGGVSGAVQGRQDRVRKKLMDDIAGAAATQDVENQHAQGAQAKTEAKQGVKSNFSIDPTIENAMSPDVANTVAQIRQLLDEDTIDSSADATSYLSELATTLRSQVETMDTSNDNADLGSIYSKDDPTFATFLSAIDSLVANPEQVIAGINEQRVVDAEQAKAAEKARAEESAQAEPTDAQSQATPNTAQADTDPTSRAEPTQTETTQDNDYVSNGSDVYGYKYTMPDGTKVVYDPTTRSYVETQDALKAAATPPDAAGVTPSYKSAFKVDQQVNLAGSTYSVSDIKPKYTSSGAGRILTGEQYTLTKGDGSQLGVYANHETGEVTMYDVGQAMPPRGFNDPVDTPSMDALVGTMVSYGSTQGFLQRRPEGFFIVDQNSNEDVLVEGGESGVTALELGVEPTSVSVELGERSTSTDPLAIMREQIREAQNNNAQSERNTAARIEDAQDTRYEAEVLTLSGQPFESSTNSVDYLSTADPMAFTSRMAQMLVSRALATKNEQTVVNALSKIMQGRAFRNSDRMTALGQLTQPTESAGVIIPADTSGFSDRVFNNAVADQESKPSVNITQPISKMARALEADPEAELSAAIISADINPETIDSISAPDLRALSGLITQTKFPIPAMKALVLADATRGKSEPYTRAMTRAMENIYETATEAQSATLANSHDRLMKLAVQLQSELNTHTAETVEAMERREAEIEQRALDQADPVQTIPSEVTPSDAVLVSDPIARGELTTRAKETTAAVSAETLVNTILTRGLINPYTRSTNFSHPLNQLRVRTQGRQEADIQDVLLDIQAVGLLNAPHTQLGKDGAYASALLEAIVLATSDIQLGTPSFYEVEIPSKTTGIVPVPSDVVVDEATSRAFEATAVAAANEPAYNVITGLNLAAQELRTMSVLTDRFMSAIQDTHPNLPAEQLVNTARLTTAIAMADNMVASVESKLDAANSAKNGIAIAKRDGLIDAKSDDLAFDIDTKIINLEAVLAEAIDNTASTRAALDAYINSDPALAGIGDLSGMTPALSTKMGESITSMFNETTADSAPIVNNLITRIVKAYQAKGKPSTYYERAYNNNVLGQTDLLKEIADRTGVKIKLPRVGNLDGDNKLAQDAVSPVARPEIPFDALDRFVNTDSQADKLKALAAIDSAASGRSLEGIATYLSNGDDSFLPKSALDGYNFEGIYAPIDNYPTNERGYLSITGARAIAGNILANNSVGQSRDRAIAESILHATQLARELRADAMGIPDAQKAEIRNAGAIPVGHPYLSGVDQELATMMEQGDIPAALRYIANHSALNQEQAGMARALAELSIRFAPDLQVDIDTTTTQSSASFDWNTYTVSFKGDAHANPYAVLHEMSHALADTLFNVDNSYLTEKQIEARDALTELYKEAKRQGRTTEYSNTDVREWLAESFSNFQQQEMLRDMDTSAFGFMQEIRKGWDYFVNRLRDLFNIDAISSRREKGKGADDVHTALTDIVSLLHMYSKPTTSKAWTPENSKDLPNPAATVSGNYLTGYKNANSVLITDSLDPFRDYRHGGFIRKISPSRYELVLFNEALEGGRQVGTLPQLMAILDKQGNRYGRSNHIRVDGELGDYGTWAKPAEDIGGVMVDYTLVPPMFRKVVAKYINKTVDDVTAKVRTANIRGDTPDLPLMFKMLNMMLNASRFLRQLPTRSMAMVGLDQHYASEAQLREDLLQDRDLHEAQADRTGKAMKYSNGRNSRLAGIRRKTDDLLKQHGLNEDTLGWYINAKHTIERNAKNEGVRQAGFTTAENGWSGLQYKGMQDNDAANALLSELEQYSEVLDSAFELIKAEHRRVLAMELSSGLINRDEFFRLRDYEYYVPLLNMKKEEMETVHDKTLRGRFSQPANGYISLYESLQNRQRAVMQNDMLTLLGDKLNDLSTSNIASVNNAKIVTAYDPDVGGLTMRVSKESGFGDGEMIFYRGGKGYVIKPNKDNATGGMLHRYFEALKKPQGNKLYHKILREMLTILSAPLVVFNPSFLIKSAQWGLGVLMANTQAAYRVNGRDAVTISRRAYVELGKMVVDPSASYMKGMLTENGDPVWNYFNQEGGGLTGFTAGGHEVDRSTSIINSWSSAKRRKQNKKLLSAPESLGNVYGSDTSNYIKGGYASFRNAIASTGELTNTFDQMTRFASWKAALTTLGTAEMVDAMRSGDTATLHSLLLANPALAAKLNSGSKRITGNFQEKSLFDGASTWFMFFNAGMQGIRMINDMMGTRQGKLAAAVMGLIGFTAAMGAMYDDDDLAADGRSIFMNNPDNGKAISFNINNTRVQIPVDYAFRPFLAAGHYFAGIVSGNLEPLEAMGGWFDASKDSYMPISPADTDSMGVNMAQAIAPTAVRSLVLPFAGLDNFRAGFNNVTDSRYAVYDENSRPMPADRVVNWQIEGKYDWSVSMAKFMGVGTPRSYEVLASNLGGDIYRTATAGVYGKDGAVMNNLMRTNLPPDRMTMALTSDFRKLKGEFGGRLTQYEETLKPNDPLLRATQEAYEALADADAAAKKATARGGYTLGATFRGLKAASNDADKQMWLDRQAEVYYNQAQIRGEGMNTARAIEKAVDQGEYASGEFRNPLMRSIREVDVLYNDPNFVNKIMERIK